MSKKMKKINRVGLSVTLGDEKARVAAVIDVEEIWVNEFNELAAAAFRKAVMKRVTEDPSNPIIIYIDSYGGQVDALAKMIETMDEVTDLYGTTFITACMGKAMSCGAILLSHGDLRYCGPHSRVMVHEVSSITAGCVHDITNDASETQRINEHFLGLLATNCNIKSGYKGLRKLIKGNDGRNIWLDAEESLDFGIADYIGLPKIKQTISYESVCTDAVNKAEKRKQLAR